jgi:hypothetical protein
VTHISRRDALRKGAAYLAVPLIGQCSMPLMGILPAAADGGATASAVIAAIQVAQALIGLTQGSSGLGERLEAMQLTLNAILETQVKTLEAISLVNLNVEALRHELPELFRQEAYRRSLEQTKKSFDRAKDLSQEIMKADRTKLKVQDFERFVGANDEMRAAASQFDITVRTETIKGIPGVAAMIFAGCSARLLAEECWILTKLSRQFPKTAILESWKEQISLGNVARVLATEVFSVLKNNQIPTLINEQTDARTTSADIIKHNVWGPPIIEELKTTGKKTMESCLRSPYRSLSEPNGGQSCQEMCNRFVPDAGCTTNCVPTSVQFSLTDFERRQFVLEIEALEPTNNAFVRSMSAETKWLGWEVPAAQRGALKGTPHQEGSVNAPASPATVANCPEVAHYAVPELETSTTNLVTELERHAQATLYINSLESLGAVIEESRKALDKLRTTYQWE